MYHMYWCTTHEAVSVIAALKILPHQWWFYSDPLFIDNGTDKLCLAKDLLQQVIE